MSLPFDWTEIDLVVFDVDGTLYSQRALRARIIPDLVVDAIATRTLTTLAVIKAYRAVREALAEAERPGFEEIALQRASDTASVTPAQAAEAIAEWIETRPLKHLRRCRYPGTVELFAAVRRSGKTLAVLSDYPAAGKLRALELEADFVACAGDSAIGMMKPHPKGLLSIIARAGTVPGRCVMIGDRADRDGLAASRCGSHALIRGGADAATAFRGFADPVFQPLLRG